MEVHGLREEGAVPALFHTIEITIHLEGEDISPEKATRAAKLSYEKYCSVSKMIDSVADIKFKIILNGTLYEHKLETKPFAPRWSVLNFWNIPHHLHLPQVLFLRMQRKCVQLLLKKKSATSIVVLRTQHLRIG